MLPRIKIKMNKIKDVVDAVTKAVRLDGWYNSITGLGTSQRDKNIGMNFSASADLTDADLADMYDQDDIAAKIVDAVPEEAFRQKITVESSNSDMDADDQASARDDIQQVLDDLGAHELLYEAATWGRLFGGGIVVVGADDGSAMDMPLVEERVIQISFLNVLDKRDLNPVLTSQGLYAGTPELYSVVSSGLEDVEQGMHIHASRLLIFGGALTTRRKKRDRSSWDLSVLDRVKSVMAQFASDWQSVSLMMSDASQGVLKIDGFYEMLAQGLGDDFQTRLDIMNLAKFVGRILPIDKEEDYLYASRTFSGLPELLDRSMYRISAATGIPVTKLFGRSPAGMNATGESDLTNWYNLVESVQTRKYSPLYDKLVRIAAHAVNIAEPDAWHVTWPSLWSESPQEAASTRKTQAETDQIYISTGVVDPDEVTPVRFAGGQYTYTAPSPDMSLREPFSAQEEVEPVPFVEPGDTSGEDNTPQREDATRQDASDRWLKMVPPVILDDLEAAESMVAGGMPAEAIRPVFVRLAQNLGVATQEVLDDIANYDEFRLIFTKDLKVPRQDAADVSVPPIVVTYLVAFNALRSVWAPPLLLKAVAHRIVDGLGVGSADIHDVIDHNNLWSQTIGAIEEVSKNVQHPVNITISVNSCEG
jgi:phage-related protein (TIGR01555 family)